jgi:hypothetical protein
MYIPYVAKKLAKKFPTHPEKPEKICWGCDKYCPSDSLACGNGSDRTQHPVELFGQDWIEWGLSVAENVEKSDPCSEDGVFKAIKILPK